jgi:hypothetical protein
VPITSSWSCEEAEVRESRQQASIRKVDVHTLRVTYSSLDGKVRRENRFVLNANGKSISENGRDACAFGFTSRLFRLIVVRLRRVVQRPWGRRDGVRERRGG